MPATTADLVNLFIELDQKRKSHEGAIDAIKEELARLETELMQRFENAGIQSMKSTSGYQVYVRRDLWAGAIDGQDALLVESLKLAGLGDMVKEKCNTQTLSAYVREIEKANFTTPQKPDLLIKALPAPMQAAVSVTEKYSLRTRKG